MPGVRTDTVYVRLIPRDGALATRRCTFTQPTTSRADRQPRVVPEASIVVFESMRIRLGFGLAVWCATITSAVAEPRPTVDRSQILDLTPVTQVPVVVYRSVADLAVPELWTALDVAGDVLATASVDASWTICGPEGCPTPEPSALKIRLVQSPGAGARDSRVRLGDALIDGRTKRGVLATVYVDRTRRVAGDLRIDHEALLGHTIAHELGHLLLATTTHAKVGLMREAWSRQELIGTSGTNWVFTAPDVASIRARLAQFAPGAAERHS